MPGKKAVRLQRWYAIVDHSNSMEALLQIVNEFPSWQTFPKHVTKVITVFFRVRYRQLARIQNECHILVDRIYLTNYSFLGRVRKKFYAT